MNKIVDLNLVIKIDGSIRRKTTGRPQAFAKKLKIARTTLFETIAYLKEEMRAPIVYNEKEKTYEYEYWPKFYLGDEIVDDMISGNMDQDFGGDDYEETDKHSSMVDTDNVILDDKIKFNELFIDD